MDIWEAGVDVRHDHPCFPSVLGHRVIFLKHAEEREVNDASEGSEDSQ